MANIVLAVRRCLVMDILQSLVLLVFVADVADLLGSGWLWCVDIDSNGKDNDNGANIVVVVVLLLDTGVALGIDAVFINPLLIETIFFLRSLQLVFILNFSLNL